MIDNTEPSSFPQSLLDRLRGRHEKAAESVQERIKAERRADMTEKERGRRGKVERKQLNARVTVETFDLAHELAAHLGDKSIPEVLALALASLAVTTQGFKRKGETQQ